MDTRSKEMIPASADEDLKVFVRVVDRALEPSEIEIVAGGAGPRWIPDG